MQMDDFAGAMENNGKAIEILGQLSRENPTNATFRRSLGMYHFLQGDALDSMERSKDALISFRRYAAIAEEISAADPRNITPLVDRVFAYEKIGLVLLKTGDPSGRISNLQRALDLCQSVYDADPGDLYKQGLFIEVLGSILDAQVQAGNISAALAESRKTTELLARVNENSETSDFRMTCARTRSKVASVFETASRKASPAEGRKLSEEARSQYE